MCRKYFNNNFSIKYVNYDANLATIFYLYIKMQNIN